ncbi:uncharacterized protein LOC120267774 [Dioscorea cayenensis subsp. rotundata]|uniref:Uncharacterized protein LOC120267774 n=1 Tax=Dioscorea cayennensis subsp. rotundata TaxID=55577 RepID=A0AB40BV90_DIOCR|nr:uncharacterized protein LOC120267774 [Dioscorea cayenensis subsp. rotundata]
MSSMSLDFLGSWDISKNMRDSFSNQFEMSMPQSDYGNRHSTLDHITKNSICSLLLSFSMCETMSTECEPKKRRYDLSMSRRTRKPFSCTAKETELQKISDGENRVSLKELMNEGNEGGKAKENATFEMKKNMSIVVRQGEAGEGGKMSGIMSRYTKILSHLIKAKRETKKRANVKLFLQQ